MILEPVDVGFASVGCGPCGPPVVIFIYKCFGQKDKPPVVCDGGADPDRAGMVPMRGFITVLATSATLGNWGRFYIRNGRGRSVMRSPEELGGLQEHLDDVFVAVIAGGNPRVVGKEEDVHPAAMEGVRRSRVNFSSAVGRDGVAPAERR